MELMLTPGDKIKVTLKDTDGEFTLEYAKNAVRITSDLPDTNGRKGVIYEEKFGKVPTDHVAWGPGWETPKAVSTKQIPSHNAVRIYGDFVAAAQFSLIRPDEAATGGNSPETKTLVDAPANTMLVLFADRLRPGGLVPSAKHTFVKSKGYWWPKPEDEPHNAWTSSSVRKFIHGHGYGYAIFHQR
jgi:hypothetical protein